MSIKLTPCTIVPPELYVLRDADKQLKKVLRDMGRPGYILVARQMGKTNLLLNAKRDLEGPDNAVIYIDLSAPFESERECFRHIIDTALDTGPSVFATCKTPIFDARRGPLPPSYKEHENELRMLLAAIPGKLVIILDEIDSLTKGAFSDKIFAQIRSVYFSRTNYEQFKRLTYVLSGVVEPNEIIKDKRISPFNIGEKIYLDDFTYEQFLDFVSRAGLDIGKDSVARIYYWANGNPRMTWDICFDIEEKREAGRTVTVVEVDASVTKLYLQDFARAPIDHIREVVTADDELRSSIAVVKSGQGNTLPDAIKNKLYLAGIIRSAANHGDISIKNRIIETALSDQWLLDISIRRKGLAKLAAEHYDEYRYAQALSLYEQLLQNPDSSTKEKETAYLRAGLCAYYTGQYQQALTFLEKAQCSKADFALRYYERAFCIGACYLQIGNLEASRKNLLEALENPTKNITSFIALVNLGVICSREKKHEGAVDYYQQALTNVESSSLPPEDRAKVKSSALYSLAMEYSDAGDGARAEVKFQEALEIASPSQRPAIMLGMYKGLKTAAEKELLLTQCVDLIISNNMRPDASQREGTLGFTASVLYALLRETYLLNRQVFDRLFVFASSLEELKKSSSELLLTLAYLSTTARDVDTAIQLARQVVQNDISGLVSKDTEFESYRLLSLLCRGNEKKTHQLKYVECLKSGYEPKTIDSVDLEIFAGLAVDLIESKKPDQALEYIELAKPYKRLVPQDQLSEFAALSFYEMLALRNAKAWSKLHQSSKETLTFLESLNGLPKVPRLVSVEGIKQIEDFARSNLRSTANMFATPVPVRTGPKYGRNDKVSVQYHDGAIKRDVKYKRVEADVVGGRCVILNSLVNASPTNPGQGGQGVRNQGREFAGAHRKR